MGAWPYSKARPRCCSSEYKPRCLLLSEELWIGSRSYASQRSVLTRWLCHFDTGSHVCIDLSAVLEDFLLLYCKYMNNFNHFNVNVQWSPPPPEKKWSFKCAQLFVWIKMRLICYLTHILNPSFICILHEKHMGTWCHQKLCTLQNLIYFSSIQNILKSSTNILFFLKFDISLADI